MKPELAIPLDEFIDSHDGHSFQFPLNPEWLKSDGFGKVMVDGEALSCEFNIMPGTLRVLINSTYLGEDETLNGVIQNIVVPLYQEKQATSPAVFGFVWLERKLPPHLQKAVGL